MWDEGKLDNILQMKCASGKTLSTIKSPCTVSHSLSLVCDDLGIAYWFQLFVSSICHMVSCKTKEANCKYV